MPSAHLGNSFDNTCITPFVGRFVPKLTNRCALKPILCEDCQSIRAQVLVDSRHRRLPELLLQTDFARAHSLQVRCGPFRSYCSKSTSLEPARSKSTLAPSGATAPSRLRSSRLAPSPPGPLQPSRIASRSTYGPLKPSQIAIGSTYGRRK